MSIYSDKEIQDMLFQNVSEMPCEFESLWEKKQTLAFRDGCNGRQGHSGLAQNRDSDSAREEITVSEGLSEKTRWNFQGGMYQIFCLCLGFLGIFLVCILANWTESNCCSIVGLRAHRWYATTYANDRLVPIEETPASWWEGCLFFFLFLFFFSG